MAIKRAQYSQTKVSGEDVYHFQTDGKMVKILDGSHNELGTLEELGFTGKVVNGGSFKDLKISGNYMVKGLTDLPTGFPTDKISILSIKSVGQVGNPDLIIYNLYGQSGESYQNTVTKTGQSGWTEGGTTLKNSLTTIQNQIGTLSNLKTTSKISVVGAVNELKSSLDSHASTLNSHATTLTSLQSHNHDEQYIKKIGDGVWGDLVLRNGKYISGRLTSGAIRGLVTIDENNVSVFGDRGSTMKLQGQGNSSLTYNDKKVWTEHNMGSGSGLDADRLDGLEGYTFARRDGENTFRGTQNIFNGVNLFPNSKTSASRIVHHSGEGGKEVTGVVFENSGRIRVQLVDSPNDFLMESNGAIQTYSSVSVMHGAAIKMKRWSNRIGKGFEMNDEEDFRMYNWDDGITGFSFNKHGVAFPHPISIQGNKIYIQEGQPATASKGDVWIDI